MGESMPHNIIYRENKSGKERNLRNHALWGQGKTGRSSKHTIYGNVWAGKKKEHQKQRSMHWRRIGVAQLAFV